MVSPRLSSVHRQGSVLFNSDEFLKGILRNLAGISWRKPDRNPVTKKSSEFNGAHRELVESIESVARKQRKRPLLAVGTGDLGYY